MRSRLLLAILLLSFLAPFSWTSPSAALEFTAKELWFFVSEPTTIKYDEMSFSIRNGGEEAIRVVCGYERIEGINVTLGFTWANVTLGPGEKISNNYWITVSSALSVTHIVQIVIRQSAVTSPDSKLSVGGAVINRISYYSEKDGSLLNLNVVDQSGEPRNSTIKMKYKVDESMSWNPIKEVNATRYEGYLPNGYYLVQAIDIDTGIYAEKLFQLVNDSIIDLVLELVGFNRFEVITEEVWGLNFTINNFVGLLSEVRIYGEIYIDGQLRYSTEADYHSQLEKTTSYGRTLWFKPFRVENGNYRVWGVIKSYDLIIASQFLEFSIDDVEGSRFEVDPVFTPLILLALLGSVCLIAYKIYRRRT